MSFSFCHNMISVDQLSSVLSKAPLFPPAASGPPCQPASASRQLPVPSRGLLPCSPRAFPGSSYTSSGSFSTREVTARLLPGFHSHTMCLPHARSFKGSLTSRHTSFSVKNNRKTQQVGFLSVFHIISLLQSNDVPFPSPCLSHRGRRPRAGRKPRPGGQGALIGAVCNRP